MSDLSPDPQQAALALLHRRFDRERQARKAAEGLLTDKSRELWAAMQAAKDAERRLQLALWATGEGIWEWNVGSGMVQMSHLELAGQAVPIEPLTIARLMERVHPADQAALQAAMDRHLAGLIDHLEQDFRWRVGTQWRWLRVRGRALDSTGAGEPQTVTGTISDVSDHHEAQRLRQLMAHAFASTLDALVVVDAQWKAVQANASFVQLLGMQAQSVEGLALQTCLQFEPALVEPQPWRGEARATAAGRDLILMVSISRVDGPGDGQPQFLVALHDITERRQAEQALEHMALFDNLTGLANRAAINKHLNLRVSRPNPPNFTVMFVDLDGFKAVNDNFGHRAGDGLLQQAAERLKTVLPQAFIGRWGGDEFVLVLADGGDDYLLRESAQLIIASLGQPFLVDSHRLSVTPSIGAVNHPENGQDAALLLRRADSAMYAAKAMGRNCLVVYTPSLDDGVERRSRLQSLVRADAERNAFHFLVQPKVDKDRRSQGAELLMRWTTEEFGPVSPAEFIPIAEQIGLMPLMGRQALLAAARIAQEARLQGSAAMVSVNLSPRQLLRPDLERTVMQACERHGVAPGSIELELTESALVTDVAHVEKLLGRLRKHGFCLSLDDFGTGYSSLSHLRNLPFHKVKIDRSFVMDLERSAKSQVMLDGLVHLCSKLGLATVAEGVETEGQFKLLSDMGVTEFQGYLFARPQWHAHWLASLREQATGIPQIDGASVASSS